jgi:hypothetical protein
MDLNNADLEEAIELLKLLKNDHMGEDIFRMQIQGIDPKKIPYYEKWISSSNNENKNKKSGLTESDAKMYKNVFDTVLKRVK